jgi:hypothetical protein
VILLANNIQEYIDSLPTTYIDNLNTNLYASEILAESVHQQIFSHGSNILFSYEAYNQSNPALILR